jgi:hypothetical protein
VSGEAWFRPHGVLDPERHAALIANRESIARDEGIPVHLLPVLQRGDQPIGAAVGWNIRRLGLLLGRSVEP